MERLIKRAATILANTKSGSLNEIVHFDEIDLDENLRSVAWADFLRRKFKSESAFRYFLIAVREHIVFSDSDRKEINGIISYLPYSVFPLTGLPNGPDLRAHLNGFISTSIYSINHSYTQNHVEEIEKQFKSLIESGRVLFKAQHHFSAGDDVPESENQHLTAADIVLIFFCPNLINSSHNTLIDIAKKYYKTKRLVPIYAEHCAWSDIIFDTRTNKKFGDLLSLPDKNNRIPISKYENKHEAYLSIYNELRSIVNNG